MTGEPRPLVLGGAGTGRGWLAWSGLNKPLTGTLPCPLDGASDEGPDCHFHSSNVSRSKKGQDEVVTGGSTLISGTELSDESGLR